MKNQLFKYGLIGSSGKLGSEVNSVFNDNGGRQVYIYNRGGEFEVEKPELIIDCSAPEVLDKTVSLVDRFNVPLVIATTNLTDSQIGRLKTLSISVPVVQSYNFSVGVQVLLNLVRKADEILTNWDVEIEEVHHSQKKDRPSGTAKMIRSIFKEKNVNVSALRLGTVIGDHSVHFGGPGEILSIKHSAVSRRTFAQGILKAAHFVLQKKNGFYSFTDVIYSDTGFQI